MENVVKVEKMVEKCQFQKKMAKKLNLKKLAEKTVWRNERLPIELKIKVN